MIHEAEYILPNTGVSIQNFIGNIGCNIIGLGNLNYMWIQKSIKVGYSLETFYKDLKNGIIDYLEKDLDYAQLGLIQVTKPSYQTTHKEMIEKTFTVVFTIPVKGGHGNGPLFLIGIDLVGLRPDDWDERNESEWEDEGHHE